MATEFTRLNSDWNADPNAPNEHVLISGSDVILAFELAGFFRKAWEAQLIFENCVRYRLGGTNDEGWYRGQCRFGRLAPEWGQFYEVSGDLLEHLVDDWVEVVPAVSLPTRHYLFYLRDSTFECDAAGYRLEAAGFV